MLFRSAAAQPTKSGLCVLLRPIFISQNKLQWQMDEGGGGRRWGDEGRGGDGGGRGDIQGHREGAAPKWGGTQKNGFPNEGTQISRFLPSLATFFFLSLSVCSRGILVVFETPGPSNVHVWVLGCRVNLPHPKKKLNTLSQECWTRIKNVEHARWSWTPTNTVWSSPTHEEQRPKWILPIVTNEKSWPTLAQIHCSVFWPNFQNQKPQTPKILETCTQKTWIQNPGPHSGPHNSGPGAPLFGAPSHTSSSGPHSAPTAQNFALWCPSPAIIFSRILEFLKAKVLKCAYLGFRAVVWSLGVQEKERERNFGRSGGLWGGRPRVLGKGCGLGEALLHSILLQF